MSNLSELMSREINTTTPLDRPGCVSFYSIILGLFGGGIGVLFIILGLLSLGEKLLNSIIVIVVGILLAILYIVLAIGLWQLRKWSRILIILLQSIAIIIYFIRMIYPMINPPTEIIENGITESICGMIASTIGSGIVIYWFGRNGKYFTK